MSMPNHHQYLDEGDMVFAEDLIRKDYSLFPDGEKGELHTQNNPNDDSQRDTIIERRGRIHVRCEHRDIAHGYYSANDDTPCTLIVLQFCFDPNGPTTRIKKAHIKIRFSAMDKGAVDPEVVAMYPEGSFSVEPTTQKETVVKGGGLNLGGGLAGIELGAELKLERTIERETASATRIRGSMDIDGRNWGLKNSVSWDMWENGVARTGVVPSMQAGILLKRRDFRRFKSSVTITIGADSLTTINCLLKTNPKDDDVFYDPERQPPSTNRLQKYDVDNLKGLDLESLGHVTFRTFLTDGVKEGK